MTSIKLRPPLPPPLSHDEIPFVSAAAKDPSTISNATIAAIAAAINELLPQGDLIASADGTLRISETQGHSAWLTAARFESVERDPR